MSVHRRRSLPRRGTPPVLGVLLAPVATSAVTSPYSFFEISSGAVPSCHFQVALKTATTRAVLSYCFHVAPRATTSPTKVAATEPPWRAPGWGFVENLLFGVRWPWLIDNETLRWQRWRWWGSRRCSWHSSETLVVSPRVGPPHAVHDPPSRSRVALVLVWWQ